MTSGHTIRVARGDDVAAGVERPPTVLATIGPPKEGVIDPGSVDLFDAHLPLDEPTLEAIGVAIAYYMLDAMACQDEVDLVYWQWWDNIEAALNAAYGSGSPQRRRRIERFVARFDRN